MLLTDKEYRELSSVVCFTAKGEPQNIEGSHLVAMFVSSKRRGKNQNTNPNIHFSYTSQSYSYNKMTSSPVDL